MEWILIIGGGILLADILLRVVSARIVLPIFEGKPPFRVKASLPDPTAEPVSFPTSQGLTLRGSLHRGIESRSRGLVIFCPEVEGNHWSAVAYCDGLLQAGFDVLSFDFRNQGESDPMPQYAPLHWLTNFEVQDALAAIKFVKTRDDLRNMPLGVFGVSRGGGAALAVAALSPDVERVATDGAFSTESVMQYFTRRWGKLYFPPWIWRLVPQWHIKVTMSLVRFISAVRRGCRYTRLESLLPRLKKKGVLMMSGKLDNYVAPEVTARLYRLAGSDDGVQWIIPDAKHNEGRSVMRAEYDRCLVQFFDEMTAVDAVPAGHFARESYSPAAQ